MLGVTIEKGRSLKVLCLEIGCGGTLLNLLGKYKKAEVYWVVFSSDPQRGKEARSSAKKFLAHAGSKTIEIKKFRNSFFPYVGGEIKKYFEALKDGFSPDLIFTHYRMDLHQDHRIISELTWSTFRNHFILEYEIPKYDGDIGSPNLFVPLEYSVCKYKSKNILEEFKTQGDKHWLTEDILFSILRIRGMECVSPSNYAEAFYCRKMIIN
jgi:LmbE family N-acetylglucosaminyl deacetylase